MRTIVFSCLVALGIATAIWFQQSTDSPAGRYPRTADAQARPENATVSKPQARPPGSKAAVALRSTNILAAVANQPPASGTADDPEKGSKNTPTVRVAAQEEPSVQPKSAAEAFKPFLEDDPSIVFPPSTVQYHSVLQSETADADWGPATAAALRNYIASQYGDRFEIPLVDCRRDLCELQVAGRIGGDSQADMRDVQQIMGLLKQSALWSTLQLDQETSIIGISPDGRMLWLSFISRI